MKFNYINTTYHLSLQRKATFYPYQLKKIFIISFLFFSTLLALGKFLTFINNKNSAQASIQASFSNNLKTVALPSVVVNLKSKRGPRLARVTVQVKTLETATKNEILSKDQSFKKHLLLILSGQNTKDMNRNTNIFEKKIKTQMNAFLTEGSIEQVHIQTQLLN
ncbi:MAG: flagellar basal body-associated FliL family protein [Bdellovibrionales bacterium]